jgi:chitinase
MSFYSKMENRKVNQAMSGYWHQWEGRGYKEKV